MLKKIVYFVDGLNTGGVENVVLQLSKELDPSLFEVHIISLYQDQIQIEGLFPKNIKIYHLSFTKTRQGILFYCLYFREVCNLLMEISPHIIHAHNSSFSYFFLACAIKMSLKDVCNVRTIHFSGFFLLRKTWKDKMRFLFDKWGTSLLNSTMVSVSPTVFQLVRELYPLNKMSCILNGVDCYDIFNPSNKSLTKKKLLDVAENDRIVVYVSRIALGKNHHTLLKAWQLVIEKMSNVHLLIIGDGPLLNEIENEVENRNLSKTVIFAGAVLNVADYLSVSDLAVFPSLSEGLGLVLLEKMSMKLAVIVSKIPPFTNIVKNNENGVFYEALDEKDLSQKMESLLLDETQRKVLGENARKMILENFSLNNMIQNYERIYLHGNDEKYNR